MAFELVRPISFPLNLISDVTALQAISPAGLTQGEQRYIVSDAVVVKWQADCDLPEDQSRGIIIPNTAPANGRWVYFDKDSVGATSSGGSGATVLETYPLGLTGDYVTMAGVAGLTYATAVLNPSAVQITGMTTLCGQSGVDNVRFGIYDVSGNVIASTPGVASATGFLSDVFTGAPIALPGGKYFFAVATTGNSSTRIARSVTGVGNGGLPNPSEISNSTPNVNIPASLALGNLSNFSIFARAF